MPDFSDKKYNYANILKRMLQMVPIDLDKREGSVIWTTLAPNARVLSQLYDLMQINQKNQYADTANRSSLIRLCKTRGITPYPATPSTIIGNFYSDMAELTPFDPTSGDTFIVQDSSVMFKVTSKISTGKWKLICTSPGEVGNIPSGRLIPTENMGSLFAGATIDSILIYGEDEEPTEHLRERYVKSFETKAYSGNRAFYRQYTESLPGVGGAKIYRAYQGVGGHVGVCIVDSENGVPSSELIAEVQEALDPTVAHGEGIGVAPIDHIVDVFGATAKPLNITMTLVCSLGVDWETIRPSVESAIQEYLDVVSLDWADQESLIIRPVKMEAAILEIPDVLDITAFTLDGQTASIELQPEQVPTIGTLSGTVA